MDLTPRTGPPNQAGTTTVDAPLGGRADGSPAGGPPGDDPASGPTTVRQRPARRRWRNVVAISVVIAALGFVLVRGLGNAALFFYNVDEAVAKQQSLGNHRFRIQGSVVDAHVVHEGNATLFRITYNGVEANVRHTGEVPKLFETGIPVVLEGRWQDGVFASSRMLVKHSEVYVARNPDRVQGYDESPSTTVRP